MKWNHVLQGKLPNTATACAYHLCVFDIWLFFSCFLHSVQIPHSPWISVEVLVFVFFCVFTSFVPFYFECTHILFSHSLVCVFSQLLLVLEFLLWFLAARSIYLFSIHLLLGFYCVLDYSAVSHRTLLLPISKVNFQKKTPKKPPSPSIFVVSNLITQLILW